MKKIKKKNIASACALFAAGLLMFTGCVTGSHSYLGGERVDIPTNDPKLNGPFVARDVTLLVTTDPGTTNVPLTKAMAQEMGLQMQTLLRSRGHRVLPSGGALVELRFSLQEFRPYKDEKLAWRTYAITTEIQVPANGGGVQKNAFIVDGRMLGGKKYFIQERPALAPVQAELQRQIDAWLASVLVRALPSAR